jgi:hypothetical protein
MASNSPKASYATESEKRLDFIVIQIWRDAVDCIEDGMLLKPCRSVSEPISVRIVSYPGLNVNVKKYILANMTVPDVYVGHGEFLRAIVYSSGIPARQSAGRPARGCPTLSSLVFERGEMGTDGQFPFF